VVSLSAAAAAAATDDDDGGGVMMQAAVKLGEIESQLQRGHTTADRYSYLAAAVVDVSTPAIHCAHSLIAKIGGSSVPAGQGVQSAVSITNDVIVADAVYSVNHSVHSLNVLLLYLCVYFHQN